MCEDKLLRDIGDAVYPVHLFGRCLAQERIFFCLYMAVADRFIFVSCKIKTAWEKILLATFHIALLTKHAC